MSNYTIRNAKDQHDIDQLKPLFNQVFHPEKVGDFAEVISHYLPGLEPNNWFVAEDSSTSSIVSAFALIPWQWEMAGIRLKVAEMGIVGTHPDHQGKGLMKRLNHRYDHRLSEEKYDLAVIQGIPGFYHQFGYHYCIPMENHIEIPLHLINSNDNQDFSVREATVDDISFLMHQDKLYRQNHLFSVRRSKEQWKYLLTHSKKTEYGADYWVIKNTSGEKYYARLPLMGFGHGLTISEVSEAISWPAMEALMIYMQKEATKRQKPYIRLNLPHSSNLSQWAVQKGVQPGLSYAWQIKIVNWPDFIYKMKPVLEERLANSPFKGWNHPIRISTYREHFDLKWKKGHLKEVTKMNGQESQYTICIPPDLLTPLILGHRSWKELQINRPDLAPINQYLRMDSQHLSEETGALIDTLFPRCDSWIYEQY